LLVRFLVEAMFSASAHAAQLLVSPHWHDGLALAMSEKLRKLLRRRDDPNWPKPIRIGGPGGALRYKAQEVKDWIESQPRV
jgi:predicted DNA-binding transcriptional regulator AlpA